MLKFLSISNLAVIHRLSVEFHAGLNLLTGETGAGKSIIVDALDLLLGGRGAARMIRTGESVAYVEGVFEVAGESGNESRRVLAEVGIEIAAQDELLIRREVHDSGRSRVFVNDRSVTTTTLKILQPYLVEIHGQGEMQALFAMRSHMDLLDGFAGCEELRAEVESHYTIWKAAFAQCLVLQQEAAEHERTVDFLAYQLAEINTVAPQPAEDDELVAEKGLLTHAEKRVELSQQAYAELYESDHSVLARLASVRRRLQELSGIDNHLAASLRTLEDAVVALTDVAETLRDYGAGADFSPARLEELENRIAALEKLKRKYGKSLGEINEFKEELQKRLHNLNNLSEREQMLQDHLAHAAEKYQEAAQRLTLCRRRAAPSLEQRVMEELRHVAMERAQFIVTIDQISIVSDTSAANPSTSSAGSQAESALPSAQSSCWTPHGTDRVAFLLSANPGEQARPLARVASGGELSRLMLALRTVCRHPEAEHARSYGATLVFDEIDAGVSGRVAEAVGRRLARLAERQQVLCVTHQPQLARFAHHHYAVAKHVIEGRTLTTLKELNWEERIGELARLIGGAEDAATTRETASWLLESARGSGGSSGGMTEKESSRTDAKTAGDRINSSSPQALTRAKKTRRT